MSIANATVLQLRTIKTLVLRRFQTQYGDSRAGYAWAVVEPMLWVFVLKFGIRAGDHGASTPPLGLSFEVFFATGVVLARTWRTSTNPIIVAVTKGFKGNMPLVSNLDNAYSVWILDMATGGVVMTIILFILDLWGMEAVPADILTCLMVYMVFSVFTFSFALMFAVLIYIIPVARRFQSIFMMAMFFTSGFAALLDRMPPMLRDIVSWNPLVHLIEWFREGFYPGYECVSKDLGYLFTVTICCLLFGLVGERAFRRRVAAQRGK